MAQKQVIKVILSCTALCCTLAVSYAKLPPAAKVLPVGFTLIDEKDLGGSTMIIKARKDNVNFPKHFAYRGISLEITWTMQPMADQVMSMLRRQPEAPAAMAGGPLIREEPCGKQSLLGGFYTCRKIITQSEDTGNIPPLVTWRISWTGRDDGGLVGISLNDYYGSKESALALVKSIIPKISKGKF